jgi:hypothetical protein
MDGLSRKKRKIDPVYATLSRVYIILKGQMHLI